MFAVLLFYLLILTKQSQQSTSYIAADDHNISGERQCQCVPPHLCLDNDSNTNGRGLLDIRFDDSVCPNYYEVCCELVATSLRMPEAPTRRCGLAKTSPMSPRITTDSEATQFGELPWVVLVLQRERTGARTAGYICGGSLINPQVVITAAHCVHNSEPKKIKIRAGEWNVKKRNEPLPHQDRHVTEVVIHPSYKPGILWNDIALIFVEKSFDPAENIGYACLPPKNANFKVDETKCMTSGWGKSGLVKGRHSSILKKVEVPMVDKSKCLASLRQTRLGKFYQLHRSFVCAGGVRNRDACKGDGGSPLVCPIEGQENRVVQMGIVSWGIGCGADKTPGVYVNMPMFVPWIDSQVTERNLTNEYYKYESN